MISSAQMVLGDMAPPKERAKYYTYFSIAFTTAGGCGPALGGWICDHLYWWMIFIWKIPFCILTIVLAFKTLRRLPWHGRPHRLDFIGAVLVMAASSSFMLALNLGGVHYPWLSMPVLGLLGAALVLGAGFVVRLLTAVEPLIPLSLFKNRTFSAASGVGFIIGFSMFGAIIYLPFYLQTVHGATPTAAGLELLPLVAGMLTTFILSGQLVTRTGRYKAFPIVGSSVLAVGLYLLSRMGVSTSFGTTSLYMVVVGLGVGLVMQVLVVAVQNSVPYELLGTATSTATFFRTIGGAFGVSLLNAVFNNRLFSELGKANIPPAALRKILNGSSVVVNPNAIDHLPLAIRGPIREAFSHSLETVFLVAVPFALLAFVLAWLIKEIPLRTTAFVATTSDRSGGKSDKSEETGNGTKPDVPVEVAAF